MTRVLNMDIPTKRWPRQTLSTLLLLAAICAPAWAQPCGSLANAYGPYDYRKDTSKIAVVEQYHFSVEVETLLKGMTSGSAGGDMDYTLRAVPNHHRALMAAIRLADKENTPQPKGMRYPLECWLERAVRFAPDDTVSRLIYASYFIKKKRPVDANAQLERAESIAQDNPFSHYNIGLLYLDLKNYDKALIQAHKALALGLPKKELADALRRVGKWRDPPSQAAVPAASAASQDASLTAPTQ
jgi:tetratricopeptide (TPR) repeat protein